MNYSGVKKMQDLEIFEEELTEDRIILTELISKLKQTKFLIFYIDDQVFNSLTSSWYSYVKKYFMLIKLLIHKIRY